MTIYIDGSRSIHRRDNDPAIAQKNLMEAVRNKKTNEGLKIIQSMEKSPIAKHTLIKLVKKDEVRLAKALSKKVDEPMEEWSNKKVMELFRSIKSTNMLKALENSGFKTKTAIEKVGIDIVSIKNTNKSLLKKYKKEGLNFTKPYSYSNKNLMTVAISGNNKELISNLLEMGVSPYAKNPDGVSPLAYCQNKDIAGFLIEKGVSFDSPKGQPEISGGFFEILERKKKNKQRRR